MKLVCDIGGTKTRIARQIDSGSFTEPIVFDTPNTPQETFLSIKDRVSENFTEPIEMMAGGVAAVINNEGVVRNSAHLEQWIGVNVVELAEKIFDAPAYFVNDAAVVGLGEAQHGAGREYDISVYLTVSTGLGGARIVSGAIDAYTEGSEPGHQVINYHTGETLEDLVSGSGFQARFGVDPREVSDREVWEEAARILAVGVKNTILHWSPEMVVLGGPMIVGDPAIPIEQVQQELEKHLEIFPDIPSVVPATLEDFGGLYGALVLLETRQQNHRFRV